MEGGANRKEGREFWLSSNIETTVSDSGSLLWLYFNQTKLSLKAKTRHCYCRDLIVQNKYTAAAEKEQFVTDFS